MIRENLLFKRSADEKIDDIVSRQTDAFINEVKQRYTLTKSEATLAQVKDELTKRGVLESDIEYHICDFSESLQLRNGAYLFDFSRTLFPKNKDGHIRLDVKKLRYVGMVRYSAEDIADMTISIIGWIPEYEKILINAQVENEKIKLLCNLGMTYLKAIAEKLSKKGLKCDVYESYTKEETAMIDIDYGNGISCTYTVDLLSDFQQKLLDIVEKL